jgi:hypothetical protein
MTARDGSMALKIPGKEMTLTMPVTNITINHRKVTAYASTEYQPQWEGQDEAAYLARRSPTPLPCRTVE